MNALTPCANGTMAELNDAGFNFRSHSFHKLVPELVSSGYRVLVLDFVGFGRSDKLTDWRAYSLELHKATVEHLLRHLHLLPDYSGYQSNSKPKLTLVGHNWGSMIGSSLIKDHPDLFSRDQYYKNYFCHN